MLEFNVLRLSVLISNGFKYFVFIESTESNIKDPLVLTVNVVPFQKLQDAKALKSIYGDSVFLVKTFLECELLFEIAQGFSGIKYVVNTLVEFPRHQIKKALALVN